MRSYLHNSNVYLQQKSVHFQHCGLYDQQHARCVPSWSGNAVQCKNCSSTSLPESAAHSTHIRLTCMQHLKVFFSTKNCLKMFCSNNIFHVLACYTFNCKYHWHWRRKDFFREGGSRGFSQNFFQVGAKSGEIWFLPLEIEKSTFFC